MCPPSATGTEPSDKEPLLILNDIFDGSPHPGNVLDGIRLYDLKPENLPPDMLFLMDLTEKKEAEMGFWRAKGNPCSISAPPAIFGWRTTFEFFEGRASQAFKTNWLMHEYSISEKGHCECRDSKDMQVPMSLCRVFISDGQNQNNSQQNLSAIVEGCGHDSHQVQAASDARCNSGQSSTSRPQVHGSDSHPVQAASDTGSNSGQSSTIRPQVNRVVMNQPRVSQPREDWTDDNYIFDGDYLELDDLGSASFSSENLSCVTGSSDEDSQQESDADVNQGSSHRNSNCMFNVSTSRNLNKVVFCPATSESLLSEGRGGLGAKGNKKTDNLLPHLASKENPLPKKVPALNTNEINSKNKSGGHKTATNGVKNSDTIRNKKKNLKMKCLRSLLFCC